MPGEGPDGAFKTVTLRNVALTAPYMHNGAFDTLEDVIKFYAKGAGRGEPNPSPSIDDKIGKFDITDAEIADLVGIPQDAHRHVASARSAGTSPQRPAGRGGEEQGDACSTIGESRRWTGAASTGCDPCTRQTFNRRPRPSLGRRRRQRSRQHPPPPRAAAPLGGYSSGNMHRVPGLPSAAGSLAIQNPSPSGEDG